MPTKRQKANLDDGCNPELLVGAEFVGIWEMPLVHAPQPLVIPEGFTPYSKLDRAPTACEMLCFFEHDPMFSDVWRDPAAHLEELTRLPMMAQLDCSVYRDMPFAAQLANIYRSRVIASYFQRSGATVWPLARWGDERTFTDSLFPEAPAFCGIERLSPVVVSGYGCSRSAEDRYYSLKNGLIVGRCAEVDAVNKALNAGARLENLTMLTIYADNGRSGLFGSKKCSCPNCTYAFKGRNQVQPFRLGGIMTIKQFEHASDTAKMAYLVLCLENYLLAKMPDRDWTPILEILWSVTSCESWDDWSGAVGEIIPSVFFETPDCQGFEDLTEEQYHKIAALYQDIPAAWEDLTYSVHHAAPLYANGTRGCCANADKDADLVIKTLQQEGVPLPDVDVAALSPAPARGELDAPINAADLSHVLDYQP